MAELADPADRGSLTVRDRAVEHITLNAALGTAGVVRHSSAIDKLARRELPRADVVVAGDHVHARLDVAVEWGRSLTDTGRAVGQSVTAALATMSGLTVDGVDVHIAAVVASTGAESARRSLT